MLILTRGPRESITINGPCVVHLLSVRGNQVKLGLEAPDTTRIWRTELIENALADQNKQTPAG